MLLSLLLSLASAPALPPCSLDSVPVADGRPTASCILEGGDSLFLYRLDSDDSSPFYRAEWGYDLTFVDGGVPMVAQGFATIFEDTSVRLTMACVWTRDEQGEVCRESVQP